MSGACFAQISEPNIHGVFRLRALTSVSRIPLSENVADQTDALDAPRRSLACGLEDHIDERQFLSLNPVDYPVYPVPAFVAGGGCHRLLTVHGPRVVCYRAKRHRIHRRHPHRRHHRAKR
jgi:hypothetical protein